jgi:hypothetical protein
MLRIFAGVLALSALVAPARGELLSFEEKPGAARATVKIDGQAHDVEARLVLPPKSASGAALVIDLESGGEFAPLAPARLALATLDLTKLPAAARGAALRDLAPRVRGLAGVKRLLARGRGENAAALLESAALFDGLLLEDAATAPTAKGPRIVETWRSDAYWRATPRPIASGKEPESRRSFFLTGAAMAGKAENCVAPVNARSVAPALRALVIALDDWARGVKPPASRTPAGADLVPAESLAWPKIPGLPAAPKGERMAPRIDVDGNETAGLRLPDQALPIATFVGFNARRDKDGAACEAGAAFPFPSARQDREKSGDPRRSLVERYGSRAYFVATMRVVADKMVKERLLLKEDADAYVAAAKTAPF